jgi:hypothetical protein
MNSQELLKLAYIADISGDFELADFIDKELIAASNNKNIREAVDISKYTRGVGNFFGKIPEFLGTGKYKAGPMDTAADLMMMQQNPNRAGNSFQKLFGAVDKEINLDANQLKDLELNLGMQLFETFDKADAATRAAINKVINKQNATLLPDEKKLLMEHARKTGIIGRRTNADFQDLQDLIDGKPLSVRPRSVQRVNRNTKLLAGGAAGLMAAPGIIGAFGPQAPDTTGSEVPNGPMSGMPQLGPGMGGGFGGGYNGPQAGSPQGSNYNPQQNIGLGNVNSMFDPASIQQSQGYAPTSGYSGRSEREINPAARYRSYEGMTRGESAPAYNNAGFSSQQAVTPIQTPVAPVEPVVAQPSIPPVNTGVPVQALPANFADALRPATPAEAARYEQPEPAPLTPGQIQDAMNPLSGVGY